MIKKIKHWLVERFLPIYLREDLLRENQKLLEKVKQLEEQNARLRAYIDGFESGVKAHRRIIINTGENRTIVKAEAKEEAKQ